MNAVSLYGRYVGTSIRAQMQYRTSFLLSTLAAFLSSVMELVAIWALFARFGRLEHWQLAEICVFYGIVNIAFAVADAVSTGFDQFGELYVRSGRFDRLLTRPRSLFLQLLGHDLTLRRFGRLAQGVLVFAYGVVSLGLAPGPADWFLLTASIAGGVSLFLGLMVLRATLSFWTVESLEMMNTVTYGGVETAQYPLDIYSDWLRRFFTYVVPIGCVTYFPVATVLGAADRIGLAAWSGYVSPLAGFAFLLFSVQIFLRVGVPHYTSTGS